MKISEKQFMIQRKLFSELYGDFPDLITLKIYIYLCRNFNYRVNKVITAKTTIQSDLYVTPRELDNSLDWLELNHFIRRTNNNKHQMYQAKILVAPDYDAQNQRFYSNEHLRYNQACLKSNLLGYIMLPNSLFTNGMLSNTKTANKKWTSNKLKVLMMLYAHFWFEYFGGINPDIVRVNANGQVDSVDPSFYYSLKMSEAEVIASINSMIKTKLFNVVVECYEQYFDQLVFIGDQANLPHSQEYTYKSILRPKYITAKQKERLYNSNKESAVSL
ncbi:hypothetical protein [Schinkia azotoformans]|uniref:hypothetical protein n=1 Tax=Schinkia azotoformans TaxID=1454 RepID=UPI002DBB785F|nr:hypothetical protein [Schinkia azotoformans]MEC1778325.1 hypothetical protein [Schinkia azotoformans]MED4331968.1 hypothetical protein [Schinkia azotoformans]